MLGVYGLLSYLVSLRTRELGIRIALGASPSRVIRDVLRETARVSAGGVALGLVAVFGLSRLLRGLLFGVAPTDPVSAPRRGSLARTRRTLAASGLPARRAARIAPTQALKGD